MASMPFAVRPVWICAFALLTATLSAQMPRSVSYSFDYAVTGMGGGVSSSQDYTLVAVTDDNGMASPASSAAYQLEPAVGAETQRAAPPASVETWALYD